jgi:hypothetical protein
VFEEIAGLPLHPLAVHSAVVLVPLLALVSVVYALVPRVRGRLAWAAVALAVAAPVSAVTAVLSGDAFQQARALPLEGALADHRNLGLTTMTVTLVLAAATLLLVWVRGGGSTSGTSTPGSSTARTWIARVLTAVLVVAAVAALLFIVRSGDSGARMVWEPIWQVVR